MGLSPLEIDEDEEAVGLRKARRRLAAPLEFGASYEDDSPILLEVYEMKATKLIALLILLASPALTLAQGSGSQPRQQPQPYGNDTPAPFEVTRSFVGKILEIHTDSHTLVVEDKNGKKVQFGVNEHTEFKADKKTELAGRKNLKLDDFQKDQRVKVTIRSSDSKVIEVRLEREKT